MHSSVVATGLTVATFVVSATVAHARATFETEPHLLAFETRQQIVLFTAEGAPGAMATRRADGSFDVLVPNAAVDDSIRGRSFFGPPLGEDGLGTRVSLEATADGDVRIRVEPVGEVARVVAHAVRGPDRLLIDLLPAESIAKAKPEREPPPEKSRGAAAKVAKVPVLPPQARAERAAKEEAPAKPAEDRDSPPEVTDRESAEDREEVASAPSTAPLPIAADDAGPSPDAEESTTTETEGVVSAEPHGKEEGDTALELASLVDEGSTGDAAPPVAHPEPPPVDEAVARVEPAPAPPDDESLEVAAPITPQQPGEEPLKIASESGSSTVDPHCRFIRLFGLPFCAPNAAQPGYRDSAYSSGVAHRLAAGATWLAPIRMPDSNPAASLLKADREYVLKARDGWLLPVVRAYDRAARLHPEFEGVVRAHQNVALLYGELGFGPELVIESRDAGNPARAFAMAVLGDLRREQSRYAEAAQLYEAASHGGRLASCFAARGLAAVALAEGRTQRAQTGMDGLSELCPLEVLHDVDTQRLHAKVELALGNPDGALATLDGASTRSPRSHLAELARDRAVIAETTGRIEEARAVWTDFERGRFGEDRKVEGAIGLARLSGDPSSIEAGLARAAELPAGQRERAKKELFAGISDAARPEGDDFATMSMVLAEGLPPTALDVPAQVGLAAAYRKLGLLDESRSALERLERDPGGARPEAFWREATTRALAEGDLEGADATLARWRVSRGGNPSAGEMQLRAQLLARRRAGRPEIERLLGRLGSVDGEVATTTRWEVAADFASWDPAAGVQLLSRGKDGIEPPTSLDDTRVAETLWALGRAAERHGENETALAAYRALSTHLPGTHRGAESAYRAGRILENQDDYSGARRAYRQAAEHPGALDRRFAEATAGFYEVVQPWMRRQEEP